MIKIKKETICVVCYANFCRSPVAQYLMHKKFGNKFNIISAGLNPFPQSGMDPRSQEYLTDEGHKLFLHQPLKLDIKIVKASKFVFALDFAILQALNSNFQKYSYKFRLLSFKNPSIDLSDPYKYDQKKYTTIMNNIKKSVEVLEIY